MNLLLTEVYETLVYKRFDGGPFIPVTTVETQPYTAEEISDYVENWRRAVAEDKQCFSDEPGNELLFITRPRRPQSNAPTAHSTTGNT